MTNMRILTPVDALPASVSFLAANLYARSTFGEDALGRHLDQAKLERSASDISDEDFVGSHGSFIPFVLLVPFDGTYETNGTDATS